MKHEDKELLLRDLCARLPYGVKCQIKGEEDFKPLKLKSFIQGEGFCAFDFDIKENLSLSFKQLDGFKPYLFPLSNMTKEQYNEFIDMGYSVTERWWSMANYHQIDWCNKNHFDYRGLIEKGLAIDCTNLNIY